jgi:GNAT superfamily N-acetyltransferase
MGMAADIEIRQVTTRGERAAFVKFPWQVYKGDKLWVPPLISDQMEYLDPRKNSFFNQAEVALLSAYRDGKIVGTVAPFVNHHIIEYTGEQAGGFGFFEVIPDYAVAEALFDAASKWQREKKMVLMRGPTNFTDNESPGVLLEGADCPPVMLEAHSPPYYKDLFERYGFEKDHDLYAWRAFKDQVGENLEKIPADLNKVAEAARKASGATIRKVQMDRWDEEVGLAVELFNATLKHLPEFSPMSREEFGQLADRVRMFIDPDLALFAMVDGKPVGFAIAIPDVNQVLIHLNGSLFPFNWIRIKSLVRRINVASFKLMGLLEEYRHRGIDAILYLEVVKAIFRKGYSWLDGSVTSENNPAVNLLASRLGAERFKHYRLYQIKL